MISRREFAGHLVKGSAGLVLLSGTTFTLSSCNVFTDILNWVPVGEAALNSILTILSANGVPIAAAVQAVVTLIEAGFSALSAAVQEYKSTTPPPAGTLAKIQTIFKDIVDNFSTFVTSLGAKPGILAIVVQLVQVILSTIGGFVNQLPTPVALPMLRIGTPTATTLVAITPKERTKGRFKKDFNATLSQAAGTGISCPPQAYLKVTFLEKL